VNAPKRKHLENEAKMHFAWTSAVLAVLGTFKLHFNGLNFFLAQVPKLITTRTSLILSNFLCEQWACVVNIFF
jgi:hypothetical protein